MTNGLLYLKLISYSIKCGGKFKLNLLRGLKVKIDHLSQ